MNTTDSSAPPYHVPHTLKVGSDNYAPELGASSRTIRVYAGLVTQIGMEQLDLAMEEQDHQPLAFLSGEVKGAQLK
jgi:hypothetical protein